MHPDDLLRLEGKIDRIGDRISSVDVTLAKQSEQLGEHMRRTALAEANLESVREELEPLKKAHAMWSGVGKALTVLAAAGSAVATAVKLFAHH